MKRRQCWLWLWGTWLVLSGCGGPQEGLRTFSGADENTETPAGSEVGAAASALTAPGGAAAVANAPPESGAKATQVSPPTDTATQIAPHGAPPLDTLDAPTASSDRPPAVPLPVRIAMATVGNGDRPPAPFEGVGIDSPSEKGAGPREPKLLIPEKEFARVGPERVLRVSYDDLDLLKVLNMDPVPANCVDYFPDWLKRLDGERIRIRGFMYPPTRETALPGFILARDNQICCFGRDPKVYDVFPVRLKEGTTTNYIPNRPFDVIGTFLIRPDAFRGNLENLYEIEDAEIVDR